MTSTVVTYDLLIVGGGINGCAIAREAALNGLSVLLVERDDLASHTSSASTKLIHGGLRYLEYYDFRLVAEALRERERLVQRRAAPDPADALRPAARTCGAAVVDGPRRAAPLRPARRAHDAAALARAAAERHAPLPRRSRAARAASSIRTRLVDDARLTLAQRGRRGRERRGDRDAHRA